MSTQEVPTELRDEFPWLSSWTHCAKGGSYLVSGFVLMMVPDSPYDHEWGVLYEGSGLRFVRPVSSFRERFKRVEAPGGK